MTFPGITPVPGIDCTRAAVSFFPDNVTRAGTLRVALRKMPASGHARMDPQE
jgi:hypothetical protein